MLDEHIIVVDVLAQHIILIYFVGAEWRRAA